MYRRIKPLDIVGRSFGRLTVSNYEGFHDLTSSGSNKHWYSCDCDCGNKYLARRDHLLEGRVKSCGNCQKVIDEGGWLRYITSKGDSFLFDREDYDVACVYSWCVTERLKDGKKQRYAVARGKDGHNVLFSRLVMGAGEDQTVDHINGNTLDNRRGNLRLADAAENSRNTGLRSDNSTGFKGVGRLPSGRYRAYIGADKRFIALGVFNTPEEAARAYDEAARFYFGEFACVNFPLLGEQGCRRSQSHGGEVTQDEKTELSERFSALAV